MSAGSWTGNRNLKASFRQGLAKNTSRLNLPQQLPVSCVLPKEKTGEERGPDHDKPSPRIDRCFHRSSYGQPLDCPAGQRTSERCYGELKIQARAMVEPPMAPAVMRGREVRLKAVTRQTLKRFRLLLKSDRLQFVPAKLRVPTFRLLHIFDGVLVIFFASRSILQAKQGQGLQVASIRHLLNANRDVPAFAFKSFHPQQENFRFVVSTSLQNPLARA